MSNTLKDIKEMFSSGKDMLDFYKGYEQHTASNCYKTDMPKPNINSFYSFMDKHNINLKAAEAIGWSLNLDFDKWYLTAKMETK